MSNPANSPKQLSLRSLLSQLNIEANLMYARSGTFLGAVSILFAVASIGDAPFAQRMTICFLGFVFTRAWWVVMKRSDLAIGWLKRQIEESRNAGHDGQEADAKEDERVHKALLDYLDNEKSPKTRKVMTAWLPIIMALAWAALSGMIIYAQYKS